MNQNRLTVYSNGVTRVQRFVTVKGRTPISIPVRKSCIADVLATLAVLGKVKVVEPPSYNNEATKNSLQLSPGQIRIDLFNKLSGADVKVTTTPGDLVTHGKVAGMQTREVIGRDGQKAIVRDVQILTGAGTFVSLEDAAIKQIEFTQPDVRRLIENSLAKNFQTVRPDSVLINLVLEPISTNENSVEAMLDYATPTAAWQSVYQLRLGDKSEDKPILQYNAKLDNPTDEDWLASKVTVVVGDPISLDTYLAEVIVPQRTKVDLVNRTAVGPVRSQEALKGAVSARRVMSLSGSKGPSGPQGAQGQRGMETTGGGGPEMVEACSYSGSSMGDMNFAALGVFSDEDHWIPTAAQSGGATSEEVGDYAIFTSDDIIDIRGNLSGLVRLFTKNVEAREVLFFDFKQDAQRAYRGVRLTNNTGSSLGEGICTVYLNDTLAGQFEMKNCKPGKSKTGIFARENGVDVHCVQGEVENDRVSVSLGDGSLTWQDRQAKTTTYHFENLHPEGEFEVEVNHVFSMAEPTFKVSDGVKVEKTKTGLKLTASLPQNGVLDFKVAETKLGNGAWTLIGTGGFNRLVSFFSNSPAAEKMKRTEGFAKLEKLYAEYIAANKVASDMDDEVDQLKEEQERLLELVKAGSTASQLDKWQTKLDKGEDRISAIQTTEQKKAREAVENIDARLTEAIKSFTFSWAEDE